MEKRKEDYDFDFGNFDIPDFDISDFDFIDGYDGSEDTRYTKPKVNVIKSSLVKYDNAVKMARELRLDPGERADCFVGGNFIFGDFIEAYLTTHMAKALRMTVSTLSLSQENVDSLKNLTAHGYVEELNLIVSAYFFAHERGALIPYIYKTLDNGKFRLAVASIHTKTVHFETLGGRKIIIHGSANLRSSGNIEQFTIEENPELYGFYDTYFGKILDTYDTVRKPIRGKDLWDVLNV